MGEYISREETAKAFCEKCRGYYDGHCIRRGECDVDVIQTAPSADVQPVKHGRWEHHAGMNSKCTYCGNYFPVAEFEKKRPFDVNYCIWCGARMDGDSE